MQFVKKINNVLRRYERKLKPLNRIQISKKALLHNKALFESLTKQEVWPVLKANAYGHGLSLVAGALKETAPRYMVVDSYFEALQIWSVAPRQQVLLIGVTPPENLKKMDFLRCALVVYDKETLAYLGALKKPVRVHLKVNTGMNRQGVEPHEIAEYLESIKKSPNVRLEGVCTHFADADGATDSFTAQQAQQFSAALDVCERIGMLPPFVHAAATAGSVKVKDPRVNALRLGIGLYGFNPLQKSDPGYFALEPLQPALRFLSTVVKVRDIAPGSAVGYNASFIAQKPMTVALVPVGYYEALDRRLSNTGYMLYKGAPVRLVGRVSMNLSVVDVTGCAARLWDEIEVIGTRQDAPNSVMAIAAACNTIPYEILTRINETVRREISFL